MQRQWWTKVLTLFVVLVMGAAPAWEAGAKPLPAVVTVLHALPNFTADVYVNGELTLSGFKPETATDPLELPAGKYTIEIRDVGASADSKPALEGSVELRAGENVSIIAGLTKVGDPALNVFANDVSRVPAGSTRLVVRNVADAPPFGVRLDGKLVFKNVPNSSEATKQVDAGTYAFRTTPASGSKIGPEELVLEEGTAGIVYTVGSAKDGTLDLMFQTIAGLQNSPGSVLTGDGGLAASSGFPAWAAGVMAVALIGLVGSGAAIVRRRAVVRG
ncbi:MAG TPA: DUF4397 domain-containing protein [Actinomycetota bacterium]|jgi:hypothetical protein